MNTFRGYKFKTKIREIKYSDNYFLLVSKSLMIIEGDIE
jgi:hypothetical protein